MIAYLISCSILFLFFILIIRDLVYMDYRFIKYDVKGFISEEKDLGNNK